MKNLKTELVFIIDKSGSMSGLEADTIGGFNSMLEQQRRQEGTCRVTTVFFDNNYQLIHDRIDLRSVRPVHRGDYIPGGSTALLDAIGLTIDKIVNAQRQTLPADRADKVLFVIITDGYENASRLYSLSRVKSMIEHEKSHYGWEFIFLGANIDAVQTAAHFGIAPQMAAQYVSDGVGTRLNYQAMSDTVTAFRQTGHIPAAPMEAIRRDNRTRGK